MTRLPRHHISVRVPWHDAKWNGCVCSEPADNASCMMFLPRMANKNPDVEERYVGKSFSEIPESDIPPCIGEMVTFLSDKEVTIQKSHPYKEYDNILFDEFIPTPLTYYPYSFSTIPFQWMLKDRKTKESKKAVEFGIDYKPDKEPDLGFEDSWVQNHENQAVLLNTFNSALEPGKSLVFIYAKHIPLIEYADRVIIGVGKIKKTGTIKEYDYSTNNPKHRSYLWERPIIHSIRESGKDGFILPYHEILELYKNGHITDVEKYIARASNWKQFSFGSELVDNDSAIDAILSVRNSLQNCTEILDKPFLQELQWIDNQLSELWNMRGAFPGLGPVLNAFGIQNGNFFAWEINRYIHDKFNNPFEKNPWDFVLDTFNGKKLPFESSVADSIGETAKTTWGSLSEERKNYIILLSRLSLNNTQAERLYNIKQIFKILVNPYMIFELSRFDEEPIQFKTIDKALFPLEKIRNVYPISGSSEIKEPNDKRRVRALVIDVLENITGNGNTVTLEDTIIDSIKNYGIEPSCLVTSDILNALCSFLESEDNTISINKSNGITLYKLKRYKEYKEIISNTVHNRLFRAKRYDIPINWASVIENNKNFKVENPEDEPLARIGKIEKEAALKEITASRFSVLIGPAGSGKTSLLHMFCKQPEISSGSILKLAPTGKARVQLGIDAKTIAQFLLDLDRYDCKTGRYYPNPQGKKYGDAETVIIDESSMLTEDQLIAIIDAIPNAKRYILVGDYRQLPPIGAGKPFYDIVQNLKPGNPQELVSKGYAELRTTFRQGMFDDRIDIKLARIFSDSPIRENSDELFKVILEKQDKEWTNLSLIKWDSSKDLHGKLCEAFVKEFPNMTDQDDFLHFEQSYGGVPSGEGYNYFNSQKARIAEDWQILSPVKNYGYGTRELNRFIQQKYRKNVTEISNKKFWERPFPKPFSEERILYGDKIINVKNNRWYSIYPKVENAFKYIANGEIGIVTGLCSKKWKGEKPINVTFTSQPEYSYQFKYWNFQEDGEIRFELAYAITVHKSQGSGFNIIFFILPNPCNFLSRELLYTALTRQKDKIIILHQGDFLEFKKYISDKYSDSAKRLTDLMDEPEIRIIKDQIYDTRYINISALGEFMISKSEVIIANQLNAHGITYVYEAPLKGSDGRIVKPDFTIENADLGIIFYWEHLGMLSNESYKEKWEKKKSWYHKQGILSLVNGELPDSDRVLITTQDNTNNTMGGIDSRDIEMAINLLK